MIHQWASFTSLSHAGLFLGISQDLHNVLDPSADPDPSTNLDHRDDLNLTVTQGLLIDLGLGTGQGHDAGPTLGLFSSRSQCRSHSYCHSVSSHWSQSPHRYQLLRRSYYYSHRSRFRCRSRSRSHSLLNPSSSRRSQSSRQSQSHGHSQTSLLTCPAPRNSQVEQPVPSLSVLTPHLLVQEQSVVGAHV